MLDFRLKLINSPQALTALGDQLVAAPALALDIETINWWDRQIERVALIQLAFRAGAQLRVAVIDALADLDLAQLRPCLELGSVPKAMHNAAYDAVRLARHFRLHTAPIHDTMLAARRSGEKRYSLQAQAQAHLGVQLDKSEQRGDWSQRPLSLKQLRYAALDAVCTLLLYEHQRARGLAASYQLPEVAQAAQTLLPLRAAQPTPSPVDIPAGAATETVTAAGLEATAIALLGVVTELSGRYSPERLAVSADSARVGLTGWIIDRMLGVETELDEDTVKLGLAALIERKLVRLNAAGRLESTQAGGGLWERLKPA